MVLIAVAMIIIRMVIMMTFLVVNLLLGTQNFAQSVYAKVCSFLTNTLRSLLNKLAHLTTFSTVKLARLIETLELPIY